MSAPMPERVWLYEAQHNDVTLSGIWLAMGPPEVTPSYVQIGDPSGMPYVPESALLAAEARVREIQAPVMCSVCVGRPLPSGRPCICGDTIRTEAAEMHGLRVRCFELEDENAALRADLKAAQELEQLHLQNLDAAYAERDALVPLARFAMRVHDTGDNTADAAVADGVLVWVRDSECDESPAFTQARSILAREAGGA